MCRSVVVAVSRGMVFEAERTSCCRGVGGVAALGVSGVRAAPPPGWRRVIRKRPCCYVGVEGCGCGCLSENTTQIRSSKPPQNRAHSPHTRPAAYSLHSPLTTLLEECANQTALRYPQTPSKHSARSTCICLIAASPGPDSVSVLAHTTRYQPKQATAALEWL